MASVHSIADRSAMHHLYKVRRVHHRAPCDLRSPQRDSIARYRSGPTPGPASAAAPGHLDECPTAARAARYFCIAGPVLIGRAAFAGSRASTASRGPAIGRHTGCVARLGERALVQGARRLPRASSPASMQPPGPERRTHADGGDQDHDVDRGRPAGAQIIDSSHASSGVSAMTDFGRPVFGLRRGRSPESRPQCRAAA